MLKMIVNKWFVTGSIAMCASVHSIGAEVMSNLKREWSVGRLTKKHFIDRRHSMGGRRGILFRNWLVCCSVLCCFTLTLGGASAVFAQDDDEFILEEIVVTGSRIVRNNNDSTSPIVTVDERMFTDSTTVAIETQLNKLPQFTPTLHTPTFGGDIQPNARNTPGSATVALRGIGSNRTLTLINGRRYIVDIPRIKFFVQRRYRLNWPFIVRIQINVR